MIVRRFLAGVVLAGLAVPALAAAPHARQPAVPAGAATVLAMGGRVLARADGSVVAQATPSGTAPASPTAGPTATASPGTGAASRAPSASPTPASLGAAQTEFLAFQAGKIDRSRYSAEANAEFTDAKIAQASSGLKALGAIKDITQLERAERPTVTVYVYRVRAAAGTIQMLLAVDKTGKYSGIFFRPDQQ